MEEKISVIVPLYNAEKYMNRCIESIIKQSYKNLEIILINDGSKDNTEKILKKYEAKDSRIKCINKDNSGVSSSRNLGISIATGKYILFVDADDWLDIDAITNLTNSMFHNMNYSIVRGRYIKEFNNIRKKVIQDEKFAFNSDNKKENIQRLIDEILIGNMNCYVWLILIKTDVIKNKIKFDEDISMMEDTIFYIDILLNDNDIFFSEYVTYHYYYNKNSASRSIKNCIRNYQDALQVHKIIREKLKYKNLLTDRRKKILNSKTSKIIADTINNIYRYDKKALQDLYREITESKEIMEILQKCNKEYIDIHNYIIIYFLKNKRYNSLKFFLFFRKIMAKIKDFLMRRYK